MHFAFYENMAVLIAGAVVLVLAAAIVWQRLATRRANERDFGRAIERDLRNVFAMTSPERKEAMIKGLMERRNCSRVEARRLAVEERRHAR